MEPADNQSAQLSQPADSVNTNVVNEEDNPKLSAEEEASLLAFLSKVEKAAQNESGLDAATLAQIKTWKDEINPSK